MRDLGTEIGCEERKDIQAHGLCARSFSPSRNSFHTLSKIEPRFPFVVRFLLFLAVDRLKASCDVAEMLLVEEDFLVPKKSCLLSHSSSMFSPSCRVITTSYS
jgi:hypothetical protein